MEMLIADTALTALTALMYGASDLEGCAMSKKAPSRTAAARWSKPCAADKASGKLPKCSV